MRCSNLLLTLSAGRSASFERDLLLLMATHARRGLHGEGEWGSIDAVRLLPIDGGFCEDYNSH